MAATLWIDVEDLLQYAQSYRRPSGIQRLAFEIYRVLQEQYGASGMVQFVRYSSARADFQTVSWCLVESVFVELTASDTVSISQIHRRPALMPQIRRVAHGLVDRLPPSMRVAANDALHGQVESWRAWRRLGGALWRAMRARIKGATLSTRRFAHRRRLRDLERQSAANDQFSARAKPGDVLISLGAAWWHPDYASLIRIPRERGLRFAMLVYDLIPIRHPEWCVRGHVQMFSAWLNSMLPLCDTVFAISRTTATDIENYAREQQIALAGAVVPIPIGSGFSSHPNRGSSKPQHRPLPISGSYVLFVSTIEARKNHVLLFRVWQHLLQTMPPGQIPMLVFAGRIGWLVDDMMRQIANCDYLDGKLLVVENPTDDDLTALYQNCLFTVFPSLYEGWGLPVTESLEFGKPCIIADSTSLPEAGGDLVRSFDPDNLHDACEVIRQAIEDRAGLARWEADVRRGFRPVAWSATADAIVTALQLPWAGESSFEAHSEPQPLAHSASQ